MSYGKLLASLVILAPATASAGRSFYGWLQTTEVMPERGAELASWISEENDVEHEDHLSETRWWVAPLIGIDDQLELALPLQIAWDRSNTVKGHTAFDSYGVELKYRFVTQDPVDAPALVPAVRVGLNRLVLDRETWNPVVDFIVSYETGPVHMLVDLGADGEINSDTHHFDLYPGGGVSVRAVGSLRFGAEVRAELSLDDEGASWAIAGPNMAWSHGRTWVSAMYGIGFYGIKDAPRLQWGIAF